MPTSCRGAGWPQRRYVECGPDGTFERGRRDRRPRRRAPAAGPAGRHRCLERHRVAAAPDARSSTRPTTGASRCWSTPPSSPRTGPCPPTADYLALSGHKLYAPFGTGALIGPRPALRDGRPVPGRRRGGRPGGAGRGDLDGAPRPRGGGLAQRGGGHRPARRRGRAATTLGWDAIVRHERALADRLLGGLAVDRRGPPARTGRGRAGRTSRRLPVAPSPSRGCTTPWWPPG